MGEKAEDGINVMIFRTLVVLGSAVIAVALFGGAADASTSPRQDWEHLVGWYQLGDERQALLTWAADGDLRLAGPGEPYFSHPFRSQPDGSFLWQPDKNDTERTRTVQFRVAGGGQTVGFDWVSEDGDSGFVPRVHRQPYALRELEYRNDQVRLSGTLLIPDAEQPLPAAAMIHGSGDSDRDNLWYLAIADHLARNGIAVLLPDKRGCGRSGGDWKTSSLEDLAKDTGAAVEAVRRQDGVDPIRIGLLGCSQGGSIAPLAASLTPDLAFVASLAGGVATFNELLLHESRQTLRQNGLPGLLADGFAPLAAAIARLRRPVWWKKNGKFDPLPYWTRLEIPALIVYGGEDEQDNVPVALSVERLRKAGPRDLRLEVYPDSGHALFLPDTQTVRPDFLSLLATWIHQSSGDELRQ
ncbi:MAG: alpha/beta hydrolase family protein [Thermoanaerobaculia bacterium]